MGKVVSVSSPFAILRSRDLSPPSSRRDGSLTTSRADGPASVTDGTLARLSRVIGDSMNSGHVAVPCPPPESSQTPVEATSSTTPVQIAAPPPGEPEHRESQGR